MKIVFGLRAFGHVMVFIVVLVHWKILLVILLCTGAIIAHFANVIILTKLWGKIFPLLSLSAELKYVQFFVCRLGLQLELRDSVRSQLLLAYILFIIDLNRQPISQRQACGSLELQMLIGLAFNRL